MHGGTGKESYAPRFTWFVFRKAVIEGCKNLVAENLQAEAVNTDLKLYAQFETSNSLYNTINTIWQRSEMDNLHGGIQSDCPHRERNPYLGDGQVVCHTVMENFDAVVLCCGAKKARPLPVADPEKIKQVFPFITLICYFAGIELNSKKNDDILN